MPPINIVVRHRKKIILLCSDLVHLQWSDSYGVSRQTPAVLEEIDPSGALLLVDSDHPPRRADTVLLSPCGYAGKTRQCQASESGFRLKIAFNPGVRWSVDEYLPNHFFDPQIAAAEPSSVATF